jgi:hypothetical protein
MKKQVRRQYLPFFSISFQQRLRLPCKFTCRCSRVWFCFLGQRIIIFQPSTECVWSTLLSRTRQHDDNEFLLKVVLKSTGLYKGQNETRFNTDLDVVVPQRTLPDSTL